MSQLEVLYSQEAAVLATQSTFTPSLLDAGKTLLLHGDQQCSSLLVALPAEEGHLSILQIQVDKSTNALKKPIRSVAKVALQKRKALRDFAFCQRSSPGGSNSNSIGNSKDSTDICICTVTSSDIEVWSYLPHSVDKLRLQASYALQSQDAMGSSGLMLKQVLAIPGLRPQLLFCSTKGQLYSLQLKDVLSSPTPIAGSAADLQLLPLAKSVQLMASTHRGEVALLFRDQSIMHYSTSALLGMLHTAKGGKQTVSKGSEKLLLGGEQTRQDDATKALATCSDFTISIHAPICNIQVVPTVAGGGVFAKDAVDNAKGFRHVLSGTTLSEALYVPHADSLESRLMLKQRISADSSLILQNGQREASKAADIPTLSISGSEQSLLGSLLTMAHSEQPLSTHTVTRDTSIESAVVPAKKSSLTLKVYLPVNGEPSVPTDVPQSLPVSHLAAEKLAVRGQEAQIDSLHKSLHNLAQEFQTSHQHPVDSMTVVFEGSLAEAGLDVADVLATFPIAEQEVLLAVSSSTESKIAIFHLALVGKSKQMRLVEVVELPAGVSCRGILFLAAEAASPPSVQSALQSLSFGNKSTSLPQLLCITSCKHQSSNNADSRQSTPLVSITTAKLVDLQLSVVHFRSKTLPRIVTPDPPLSECSISKITATKGESGLVSRASIDSKDGTGGASKLDQILAAVGRLASRVEERMDAMEQTLQQQSASISALQRQVEEIHRTLH